MLESLDYARRDQAMMFLGRSLRNYLPEDHLLLQIEQAMEFSAFVRPFKDAYCPDNGRPGLHPEILVRALLLSRSMASRPSANSVASLPTTWPTATSAIYPWMSRSSTIPPSPASWTA